MQAIRTVGQTYTIDRKRIVTAHGLGVGGRRDGVLPRLPAADLDPRRRRHVGAAGLTAANPREKVTNQPLSFFLVVVGGKDLGPAERLSSAPRPKAKLTDFKYPVILREVENMGHEYLDGKAGKPTLREDGPVDRLAATDLSGEARRVNALTPREQASEPSGDAAPGSLFHFPVYRPMRQDAARAPCRGMG